MLVTIMITLTTINSFNIILIITMGKLLITLSLFPDL